jgi:hypothetical protein
MQDKKYTAKDIEELQQKDPSELTPEERRIANLHPNKKGDTGDKHSGGRKKGTPNWSTHFKRLMGDEDFLNTIISSLPSQWNGVVDKYPASVIAAGLITTATQSVAKSVAEGRPVDEATLRIIDRISKIGYGDKVVHDVEDNGWFEHTKITYEVIPGRRKEEES